MRPEFGPDINCSKNLTDNSVTSSKVKNKMPGLKDRNIIYFLCDLDPEYQLTVINLDDKQSTSTWLTISKKEV
jgi:hypothetical protein